MPDNLWFIGTANQDESTYGFSDKVYDRAQVIDFQAREEEPVPLSGSVTPPLSCQALLKAFEDARKSGKGRLSELDWTFIETLDEALREKLGITFGHRIRMHMEVFVPVFVEAGGTKAEAMDIVLTRKVLRKLESRHDRDLSNTLRDLRNQIEKGKPWPDAMPVSDQFLKRKISAA